MMVCEECGSDGEDGAVEYPDGKIWHWRKNWPKDGTVRTVMCCGKFVEKAEGKGGAE